MPIIGAGTFTCNYDGFRKHKTKIGDRVQVGSDTTLVAPLTINDDVYIATADHRPERYSRRRAGL